MAARLTLLAAPAVAATPGAPSATTSAPSVEAAAAAPPLTVEPLRAVTNVSANVVAVPAGRDVEARAVEAVLSRYRNAFNTLDAGAAVAVWPTVNEKTLARAFDSLEGQNVSFERCQIETAAGYAEAACSGTARYVPKVGSRTTKAEARQWRFSLRKADGDWLIDRVDAR